MRLLVTNKQLRTALRASDEIHKYTDDISELTRLRDKAIQHHRLYTNQTDTDYEAETSRYTKEIELAQKVQLFLLSEMTDE